MIDDDVTPYRRTRHLGSIAAAAKTARAARVRPAAVPERDSLA